MATVCVSACRPVGRVFSNTAVKAVHLLTFPSVPAASLSGSRIPASASGIQPSFRELTSPQSSEAFYQKSFLPTFFERLKLSTRRNAPLDCKLYPICINRDVLCRVAIR